MWGFLASIVTWLLGVIFVRQKPEEHYVIEIKPAEGTGRGDARRVVDAFVAELQHRAESGNGNADSAAWGTSANSSDSTRIMSNTRKR